MIKRLRLDAELVRRGLASSRTEAKAAIDGGLVAVRGVPASRAATLVDADTPITFTVQKRFVSRGGEKLDGALDRLGTDVAARRWLDAGVSTGGFTDCLLKRGAVAVIGVDVGYGQIDLRLRNDERVTVMERTNVRELSPDELPWPSEGVVADLSFISLRLVLPALVRCATEAADLVLLVKPQFEVGRGQVGKGGVVRDPGLWRSTVEGVAAAGRERGLGVAGVTHSDPPGPSGNREFFLWLRRDAGDEIAGLDEAIERAQALES